MFAHGIDSATSSPAVSDRGSAVNAARAIGGFLRRAQDRASGTTGSVNSRRTPESKEHRQGALRCVALVYGILYELWMGSLFMLM